jgi:hypothetical protein
LWKETFAEENAVVFGHDEETTLNQTPDIYIKNDGFACSKIIVTDLVTKGTMPTSYPSGCPAP